MTASVSSQSLGLLEARLRRVQYVLTGGNEGATVELGPDSRDTIAARLRALDRNLTSLIARSTVAAQVVRLQQEHKSVFHPTTSETSDDGLPPAALASVVLAHAQSYELIHKQSSALGNLAVPDPAGLVPLVGLQAKIDQAEAEQQRLASQAAKLRARSAVLLESWYTNGVLDMSEHWADWEERLRDIEILVRRMETARRREDDFV